MSSSPYPTKARVREIFAHLAAGDPVAFYAHIADDVDWTIMGSHALSGHYTDKATLTSKATSRTGGLFEGPVKMRIVDVIGGEVEEWAVVEMALDGICKNGLVYNNTYSWSTRWQNGKIVQVRAYLDGLILNRALAENEDKS
ncbi:hypothetical protein F4774DRAFT_364149 [Daldinia eschscholtzii]|nr:hypothetical protein F4774DRAFT_364149 [Daldinia eschscholtzii]